MAETAAIARSHGGVRMTFIGADNRFPSSMVTVRNELSLEKGRYSGFVFG